MRSASIVVSGARGLTLIELIAVLVLGGIILAVAGMGTAKVAEGFLAARDNAATALKAQVALTRLEKEMYIITGVTSGTSQSLIYKNNKGGGEWSHTLSYANGNLLLDGDVLADKVHSFSLKYGNDHAAVSATSWDSSKKIIEATLTLSGAFGVNSAFTIRVAPRNL
jgi:prepilin-type N-terminal cleavage/methylation domain-containing protein